MDSTTERSGVVREHRRPQVEKRRATTPKNSLPAALPTESEAAGK